MLLMHLTVCGTYINVINAEYAYDILGGFNLRSILAMLLPWVAWILGELSLHLVYRAPLTSASFCHLNDVYDLVV